MSYIPSTGYPQYYTQGGAQQGYSGDHDQYGTPYSPAAGYVGSAPPGYGPPPASHGSPTAAHRHSGFPENCGLHMAPAGHGHLGAYIPPGLRAVEDRLERLDMRFEYVRKLNQRNLEARDRNGDLISERLEDYRYIGEDIRREFTERGAAYVGRAIDQSGKLEGRLGQLVDDYRKSSGPKQPGYEPGSLADENHWVVDQYHTFPYAPHVPAQQTGYQLELLLQEPQGVPNNISVSNASGRSGGSSGNAINVILSIAEYIDTISYHAIYIQPLHDSYAYLLRESLYI
ncbi:hypothetical protein DXG01_012850 [Tephrocybe rancida]|nr:hypothetical protein DXG01_012850 [Tephrocybe rancida]